MSRYRVSMDIGGTFTDVVAYDEATGAYAAGKSSTTPRDLTEGVFAALDTVVASPAEIGFTVHGTTQGLNAFLQRRGEKVLLLATRGAGDVYHIARGNRTRLYDVHFRKPTPLVPRSDIVEIGGRLNYAGEEIEPLDEEAVRAAAQQARDGGFGAVAVGFVFSYLNPAHELRAEEILSEELGSIAVSLSHRVAREWREYERTSSAVVDAYTAPVVRRYLERLESEMRSRGLGVPLHVMQSSGGIVTAQSARQLSLQTLLSGPVGGTMGGVALARILIPDARADTAAGDVAAWEADLRAVAQHLVKRAEDVDEDEADAVAEQVDVLIESWLNTVGRRQFKYAGWRDAVDKLLVPAGSTTGDEEWTFPVDDPPWPTLSSLRDVDSESWVYLIPNRRR